MIGAPASHAGRSAYCQGLGWLDDGADAWYPTGARAARIRGRDPFQVFVVELFNLLLNKCLTYVKHIP